VLTCSCPPTTHAGAEEEPKKKGSWLTTFTAGVRRFMRGDFRVVSAVVAWIHQQYPEVKAEELTQEMVAEAEAFIAENPGWQSEKALVRAAMKEVGFKEPEQPKWGRFGEPLRK